MIRYGKHVPTHRIGPILPQTFQQALKWLRGSRGQRVRLGFTHVLRLEAGGSRAVVRSAGRDVWTAYSALPPR